VKGTKKPRARIVSKHAQVKEEGGEGPKVHWFRPRETNIEQKERDRTERRHCGGNQVEEKEGSIGGCGNDEEKKPFGSLEDKTEGNILGGESKRPTRPKASVSARFGGEGEAKIAHSRWCRGMPEEKKPIEFRATKRKRETVRIKKRKLNPLGGLTNPFCRQKIGRWGVAYSSESGSR